MIWAPGMTGAARDEKRRPSPSKGGGKCNLKKRFKPEGEGVLYSALGAWGFNEKY